MRVMADPYVSGGGIETFRTSRIPMRYVSIRERQSRRRKCCGRMRTDADKRVSETMSWLMLLRLGGCKSST
jgi:hypothetical protein